MTQFKLNQPAPERFASDVLDNRDEITETRKAVVRVLGYTQVQLADATGCGTVTINNWLNNSKNTQNGVRVRIANALLLRYIEKYQPTAQDTLPPFRNL